MTTKPKTYPQYAKSTDPEVVAAILRNRAGAQEVRERGAAFSKEHGDSAGHFFYSTFFGYRVTGIASGSKPTSGRWKRSAGGQGWAPYANNPLSAEFEALYHRPEPVPGVPDMLHSGYDSNGSQRVGNPTLFVLDDVAYSGSSMTPIDEVGDDWPWEETLGSDFHRAMETYNARLAEARNELDAA